jgi:phosphoribosylaminoimidazole (AIR) synthetase
MGIGMIAICAREEADVVIQSATRAGIGAWRIGEVRPGAGRVILA